MKIKKIVKKIYRKFFPASNEELCHKLYGKIYEPIYNLSAPFNLNKFVEIYNKDGQRMDRYFFRDKHTAHEPDWPYSQKFLFDRFNYGLPIHFYSHKQMLETMGKPQRKFGILYETDAVCPSDYKIFETYKGLEKEFESIFTYSDRILDSVENAKFVPLQASPWYVSTDENAWQKKDRNVSILSSNKVMCPMHKFRYELAWKCKNEGLADTFGTFDGGGYAKLEDTLERYRYTVLPENIVSDYYFSERLTNCFMSMTIPIYCGARKIGEFFNTDGIITISPEDFDSIDKILKSCNEEDYLARLPAIKDNFNRVQKYICTWDMIYDEIHDR